MKVKKQLVFAFLALAAVFLLQSAYAVPTPIPAGDKTLEAKLDDVQFNYLSTLLAEVDSYVYQYTSGDYSGDYLYTYRITGKSSIGLSFFSIAILDVATVDLVGYESCGVQPLVWAAANSPAQSVDALFTDTVDYEDDSALLWFISSYDYTSAKGSVFGTASGLPAYANNDLYSPVPEPATLVILGIGTLFGLIGRKQK